MSKMVAAQIIIKYDIVSTKSLPLENLYKKLHQDWWENCLFAWLFCGFMKQPNHGY